ncbi:hypothetical protein BH09PAT1_BH09PAT1_2920 [soil metagenome]
MSQITNWCQQLTYHQVKEIGFGLGLLFCFVTIFLWTWGILKVHSHGSPERASFEHGEAFHLRERRILYRILGSIIMTSVLVLVTIWEYPIVKLNQWDFHNLAVDIYGLVMLVYCVTVLWWIRGVLHIYSHAHPAAEDLLKQEQLRHGRQQILWRMVGIVYMTAMIVLIVVLIRPMI